MAGIVNFIYLTATLLILGGAVAGILFVVNSISEFTSTTKEKLKSKGYHVSRQGVAVQTQKRFNREDYVDATQRGLVKAFGASSYGKVGCDESTNVLQTPDPDHTIKKSRSGLLRWKDNKSK